MSQNVIKLVCALGVILVVGCGKDNPGTSVRIALSYDEGLGLDTVDVTAGGNLQSDHIQRELLLLFPDESADAAMPIEIWARHDGKRAAYGTTTVTPLRGKTVTASLALDACAPGCIGNELTTCSTATVSCALGCSDDGDSHCIAAAPSNGIDPGLADALGGSTTIASDTVFDVDTGAITGGFTRAAGEGVRAGVSYTQLPAPAGGVPLGVFAFHDLAIEAPATVHVVGHRAVVFLVGDTARIAGTIDVSAGRDARNASGPGGGSGGTATTLANGCGAGGGGLKNGSIGDSGGGGGGAGTMGGAGGDSNDVTTPPEGGAAGAKCLNEALEPLQGGGGGGAGSPGSTTTYALGGGGGGALQITALIALDVSGTIDAGGEGGEGGPMATQDAGSGAGGGAGGAVLLEAPSLTVASTAVIVANGGGGGGSGTNTVASFPGEHGGRSTLPALGGQPAVASSSAGGGDGGARGIAPYAGDISNNAGGGGGAAGMITLRGRKLLNTGLVSPAPNALDVRAP